MWLLLHTIANRDLEMCCAYMNLPLKGNESFTAWICILSMKSLMELELMIFKLPVPTFVSIVGYNL